MTVEPLPLIRAARAVELTQQCQLRCEARELLTDTQTPREFLDLLVKHEFHANAVRFLAHALPRRETVWWGCLCLRWVIEPALRSSEERALRSAVRWVVDPSEEKRAAAQQAGEAAGLESAAGCLAWSAGTPPTAPPSQVAELTANALLALAYRDGPACFPAQVERFLTLGLEVAQNKHRWQPPRDRSTQKIPSRS